MKKFLLLSIFAVLVFVISFSTHNVAAIPGQPIINLDRSVYTWTDRVNITVIAPSQNLDPNKIDVIGNGTLGTINIATRGNQIPSYALVETGPNTGIFTGFVTLTGDPNLKNVGGVDGSGKQPSGAGPSGVGPKDGLLPVEDQDGIGVSFQTQDHHFVTKAALIHWNIGQVSWLQTSGPSSAHRILQIIDHDMNLNPNVQDTFSVPVFSNSDLAGIKLNMTETAANNGVFHGIVRFTNDTSDGSRLHLSGGNNTITGEYTDRTLPPPYTPADQIVIDATTTLINGNTTTPDTIIKLDKNAYTWTDQVNMTITAPSLNLDSNKIDGIGNSTISKITVSTRGNSIPWYKLMETGPNTGIFTGYVTLTGNPNIKNPGGIDGDGQEPTGVGPSGIGPKYGFLPAQNIDGISVTFQTPKQTVIATSPIQWNIGKITWLKSVYPATGRGICQIVDLDMSLNPKTADKFYTNVWSDSDSGGIKLSMNETGKSTGIFQGAVFFTNSTSSGNKLHVGPGDTVTCVYNDRTLPSLYTPADQLRLTATTLIYPTVPPLERVPASSPRIVDSFGNALTSDQVNQQIQIAAELTNGQNRDQPFAYLVQIKDQNGVTVSLSWITGTLTGGQSLNPAQAWTPNASGNYTAKIFVFQSIDNPLPISKPLTITIPVQGGVHLNYNSTSIILSGTVNPPIHNGTVTLLVFDPNNNLVQVAQTGVVSDGTFSTTIKAGGPLFTIKGTYTVKVEYGEILQNDLSFNYP